MFAITVFDSMKIIRFKGNGELQVLRDGSLGREKKRSC